VGGAAQAGEGVAQAGEGVAQAGGGAAQAGGGVSQAGGGAAQAGGGVSQVGMDDSGPGISFAPQSGFHRATMSIGSGSHLQATAGEVQPPPHIFFRPL
jgi:hypothetical protein